MNPTTVLLLGAGRMGGAMIDGWTGAGPVALGELLIRDPHDASTLYAGFALTPYAEIWRGSERTRGVFGNTGLPTLVAGAALIAALAVFGVLAFRRRRASPTPTEPPHP